MTKSFVVFVQIFEKNKNLLLIKNEHVLKTGKSFTK